MFNNKDILITGGTGYFGRNFISHLLKNYKPSKIIIFSRDEQKQYHLQNEFKDHKNKSILRFFIGDVRDQQRLDMAFNKIDIVIHAAALKHVPAAEYNPMECVKTNILGAQNIIESSLRNGVKKVIALSTDKAANPINIYGASKLVSDKLFVAANNLAGKKKVIFSVVRYGNVFGSTGSVVPFFKGILESNLKFFPITDEKMTRFIITIQEGIDFVIRSLQEMKGGEIFIPKIPSMKILDLAKSFSEKYPIKFIGMRPGEKLHEILCPKDSAHLTLEFKDYYIITPSILFYGKKNIFTKNNSGEKGKKVLTDFEYESASNSSYLSVNEIKKMLKKV
jgi:UDP-N-acetylglucosamine 4,6-dehydratase/5-epimerase